MPFLIEENMALLSRVKVVANNMLGLAAHLDQAPKEMSVADLLTWLDEATSVAVGCTSMVSELQKHMTEAVLKDGKAMRRDNVPMR